MSPRKYIPIPKELQKKRGRKTIESTPQVAPQVEPEIKPEPPVQPDPPVQPEPIAQPEPPSQPEPKVSESTPEPIEIAQQLAEPEPAKKEIPDELESLLNEYNASAPEQQASESHHPHSSDTAVAPAVVTPPRISLVRGYMLLLVLDFVLPTAITLAMKKFGGSRWAHLKSKDIRLSDSEFNDLEPIADEVAKDIQLNVSPMMQLMLGMAVIYSSKLMFNEK